MLRTPFGRLWSICASAHLLTCCLAFPAFLLTTSCLRAEDLQTQVDAQANTKMPVPLGANVFGDTVDLFTGELTFNQVDVSLRGNSALPVEIARTFVAGHTPKQIAYYFEETDGSSELRTTFENVVDFGDWWLDVPNISGLISTSPGWLSNQCSGGSINPPNVPPIGGGTFNFAPGSYWSGWTLSIPHHGSRLLLQKSASSIPFPTIAPFVTGDNWIIECLSNATNAAGTAVGDGFLAISPNGEQYFLNKLLYYPAPDVNSRFGGSWNMHRQLARMVATKVVDRFGNSVNYSYDASGRLTSITASDGREIDLTWTTQTNSGTQVLANVIQTATAAGHTWSYSYDGVGTLVGMTRPDGLAWTFNISAFDPAAPVNRSPSTNAPMSCPTAAQAPTGSMTTPEGLVGTFSLSTRPQGVAASLSPSGKRYTPVCHLSIAQKSLSGPGLSTLSWTYQYANNAGYTQNDTPTGVTTQWTQVTDPEGISTRSTFSDLFDWTEGNLLSEQVFASGGTSPVRTTSYTYQQGSIAGSPGLVAFINTARTSQSPQLLTRVISQDGDTYTLQNLAFDAFGNPTSVHRFNEFNAQQITETRSYLNDTTNWVLGKLKQRAIGSIVVDNYVYTALDQVQEHDRFGLLQATFGYDAAGLMRTQADGLTQTTHFDSYSFGIPQLITYPDKNTHSSVVNADGTVASETDARGFTTHYTYDPIGRLKSITYPSPDTVNWAPVTVSWQTVTTSPFGAAAVLETTSDGHLNQQTYYDPLMRAIFEKESDVVTGSVRYQRSSFDSKNKVTFHSYWDTSIATSAGVSIVYDSLSRPTSSGDTLGLLASATYLSGNRHTVTDGNSHAVTYTTQAFDEPGGDAVTTIAAPETQTTQIARDVLGHVLSISQSGLYSGTSVSATRSYIYDAFFRLCKTIDPESGESAFAFDAASNVVWKATGQTNSPTSCSPQSSTPNGTVYAYDVRNRLTTVTPPAGTDGISYGFDPDGRLLTASTPSSVWTYTYDGRGLLEKQSQVGAGQTFSIIDVLDPQGHKAQRTAPSTRVFAYSPDAWGRPSRMGSYVTGISYFANGSVAGFSYGNGVTYAQTLDGRLRPGTSKISGSLAGDMLDVTYGYDAADNVLSITDRGARGDSRTLTYDGLNRLTGGTAAILGALTITYDPLNNLRSQLAATGRSVTGTYDSTTNRITGITGTYTRSFAYDSAGDITSDGVNSYTFDNLHHLTGVSGGTSEQYRYDANNRRFQATNSSGTTFTVYDESGELVSDLVTSTSVATDYLALVGNPVAQISSSSVTYLHSDLLGSPVAATDSTGNVAWYELYLPYGSKVDGVVEKLGFTGHVQDADSGLVNMQARYFSPVIGRFLSIDPVPTNPAESFSFNRYAYGNNNPYKYIDPTGTSVLSWVREKLDDLDVFFFELGPTGLPEHIAEVPLIAGVRALDGLINETKAVTAAAEAIKTSSDALTEITVTARAIQAVGAVAPSSRALGRALEAAGVARPAGSAAHHIVAGSAKGASAARATLTRLGIGINDAENGVFLQGVDHASVHTTEYYNAVNSALANAATRDQAVQILQSIGRGLSSGAFP